MCDPQRFDGPSRKLDFAALRTLDFAPIDQERFPAITLAHTVIETGGSAGAVFNAANEIAVRAFLDGRIGFLEIASTVARTLDAVAVTSVDTLEDVFAADALARVRAQEFVHAYVSGEVNT